MLSVLAGAFISFGAIFATTVSAGNIVVVGQDGAAAFSGALPYGVMRLLTGLVFCVGLILVIVGGAELFTGNNLIVMAWASGKVRTRDLLRNWVIAFAGNFVGAFATAALMFFTTQYTFGGGAVGLAALTTAHAKTSLDFVPAFTLGIMCNALVCLAVWMCYGARTTVDRIVTIIPPITAFVAAGFEHCIANIYFIPIGLFIKAGAPEHVLGFDRQDRGRLSDPDMGEFLCRQSDPGHDRQHHWRLGHGRCRLLVRLSTEHGCRASRRRRRLMERYGSSKPKCNSLRRRLCEYSRRRGAG